MPRREHKYHVIYRTTNLLNGRYYVGMHSTSDLDDGYLGSGKRLRYAIRKYGKENFRFEVLEHLPNREQLVLREQQLVTAELVDDPMCMNLKPGGSGGFCGADHMKKCCDAGHIAFKQKLKNDPELLAKFKQLGHNLGQNRDQYPHSGFSSSHRHTEDTKLKMRQSHQNNLQIGEKNSQFGTRFMTDGVTIKRIKSSEIDMYIQNGWWFGTTLQPRNIMRSNSMYGTKWMNNGIDSKPIKQESVQTYFENGWKFGRLPSR